MKIPPFLKPGDRVAIVSPSGSLEIEFLNNALNIFETWGLKPYVSKHASGSHHIFSGTIEERFEDLQQALDDPLCKAIFCARGGYGAIQLVDLLDAKAFVNSPKWLIGFSDITVLHAWANKNGIASLHADMPKTFPYKEEDTSLLSMRNFLFEGSLSYVWNGDTSIAMSKLEGSVVGGNLSVLVGLIGTPYEPSFDGNILFLEDLNEQLYHLDRMMRMLKLNGIFRKIKGLLVGGFTDMKDGETSFGKTVEEIILDAVEGDMPVYFHFPAGHQKPNVAIPVGMNLTIENEGNEININI